MCRAVREKGGKNKCNNKEEKKLHPRRLSRNKGIIKSNNQLTNMRLESSCM